MQHLPCARITLKEFGLRLEEMGWPLVAKCFSGSNQSKRRDLNSHHENSTEALDDLVIYFTYTAKR